MRILTIALALVLCSAAAIVSASDTKVPAKYVSRKQDAAFSSGAWNRAVNGRWVWVPFSDSNEATLETRTSNRSFLLQQPGSRLLSPSNLRPETLEGSEWYLNGRSYFSS